MGNIGLCKERMRFHHLSSTHEFMSFLLCSMQLTVVAKKPFKVIVSFVYQMVHMLLRWGQG